MSNNEETNFSDYYKLLVKLGEGSFGTVYRVLDKKTNTEYAIKIEKKNNTSRLFNEYKIYKKLEFQGITHGIPVINNYFESKKKCYMIMQLLGKSLDTILDEICVPFDLSTVLKLGINIVKLLENIHNAGFLHRDIKPNNFLIGLNNDRHNVYIMDFGLSKKYIINNKHIDMTTNRSLVGTARYASVNVHIGLEPSRRDDLESVGYMLIYLLKKKLPWQGLKRKKNDSNKNAHLEVIGDCKMMTPINELCAGMPICFEKYITYCKSLEYLERPDYGYLIKLFKKTAMEGDISLKYFWEN